MQESLVLHDISQELSLGFPCQTPGSDPGKAHKIEMPAASQQEGPVVILLGGDVSSPLLCRSCTSCWFYGAF